MVLAITAHCLQVVSCQLSVVGDRPRRDEAQTTDNRQPIGLGATARAQGQANERCRSHRLTGCVVPVAVLGRPDLSRWGGAGWLGLRSRGLGRRCRWGGSGSRAGWRGVVPMAVFRRPDLAGGCGAGLRRVRSRRRGRRGAAGLCLLSPRSHDQRRQSHQGDYGDGRHEDHQATRHGTGLFPLAAVFELLPASAGARLVSSNPHATSRCLRARYRIDGATSLHRLRPTTQRRIGLSSRAARRRAPERKKQKAACLPRERPLIRLRHLLPSAEGRRLSVCAHRK